MAIAIDATRLVCESGLLGRNTVVARTDANEVISAVMTGISAALQGCSPSCDGRCPHPRRGHGRKD